MTRDEYVKWLKQLDESLKFDGLIDGDKEVDLHEMIFELCEMLEQQTCEDAVNRTAAIDALKRAYWDKDMQNAKDDPCIVDAMTDWAIRTIKDLPSVKPQPKTGHWIYSIYGGFHEQGDWLCSHCNYQFNYGNGHAEYCPKCGYEMSETSTEEVISEYDPRRSNKDYKMW